MSVFKRPNSPYYYARFKTASGGLATCTTKTKTIAEARKVQIALQDAENALAQGVPADAAHTAKLIRRAVERVAGDKIPIISAQNYLTTWLARKSLHMKENSKKAYSSAMKRFVAYLGKDGALPLHGLTLGKIQAYIDGRLTDGISTATARFEVTVVGGALKDAIRAGLIESNPASLVSIPDAPKVRREPFTREEIARLIESVKGTEDESLIKIAYLGGARLGDSSRMKWENVDFVKGTLTWIPQKTDRRSQEPHTIMMPSDLASHLLSLTSNDSSRFSDFICPTLSRLPVISRGGLSDRFGSLARSLGIKKTFHSLRHSCVTHIREAGVDQDTCMAFLGHKSTKVNLGYTHRGPKATSAAAASLSLSVI